MKQTYLKNTATLAYQSEKCIGCGVCADVCPHEVFELANGKSRVVNKDRCMECGACALNCPAGALEVDAGVGCAAAVIMSWFTGKEPTCGCSDDDSEGCC